MKKSLSGLGFSVNISQLSLGPDRGSVVRIKRLFPGQPALESGLLREGDVILSVNKEPVKDLSYQVGLYQKIFRSRVNNFHFYGQNQFVFGGDLTLSASLDWFARCSMGSNII